MKKTFMTFAVLLAACSPAREEATSRLAHKQVQVQVSKISEKAKIQSPLQSQSSSAAARVQSLAASQKNQVHFSFLEEILDHGENGFFGRIDIASNPFAQFALSSDRLQRSDLETFIEQFRAAKDEVGALEWGAFVAAEKAYRLTGSSWGLNKIQTKAINAKVKSAFPGIFGGLDPLEKSLSLMWIRKLDASIEPANSDIRRLLTAKLPVISHGDIYTDFRESIAAAVQFYPLNPTHSQLERTASFVLLQRLFAQLLTLPRI